jgi:hypothetical protein
MDDRATETRSESQWTRLHGHASRCLAPPFFRLTFSDISTETPFLGISQKERFSYPSPNSTVVAGVLSNLSAIEPKANLKHLTSYHTRYYNSDTGKESSEWFYAKILAYTAELASDEQKRSITVESVKHSWKQNSIVSETRMVVQDSSSLPGYPYSTVERV